jgi:hypothetical protein
MKFELPAVDQPIVRILVDTGHPDYVTHDYSAEDAGKEVEIEVNPGDAVGYIGIDNGGQEVGEPVLLHREPKPLKAPAPILGKQVVIQPLPPVTPEPKGGSVGQPDPANPVPAALSGTAAGDELPPDASATDEAPPETVKVDDKAEVKVTRKK